MKIGVRRMKPSSSLMGVAAVSLLLYPWRAEAGGATFGPQQTITTSADGTWSVFATDLDGDGDQDILSASFRDDKIAWHENADGMGAFGPQQVITTSADFARSVFAADLDGDRDQDVLSASATDHKMAWYENLSPPSAVGGSLWRLYE